MDYHMGKGRGEEREGRMVYVDQMMLKEGDEMPGYLATISNMQC